jgi:hypothetical protein
MATQTTTPPAPLVPTSAVATEPVSVDLETDAEAMSERFFAGALATLELATIHLGLRLGLYQAVHDLGPVTAAQLDDCPPTPRGRLRRRRGRSPISPRRSSSGCRASTGQRRADRAFCSAAAHRRRMSPNRGPSAVPALTLPSSARRG